MLDQVQNDSFKNLSSILSSTFLPSSQSMVGPPESSLVVIYYSDVCGVSRCQVSPENLSSETGGGTCLSFFFFLILCLSLKGLSHLSLAHEPVSSKKKNNNNRYSTSFLKSCDLRCASALSRPVICTSGMTVTSTV